MKTNKTVKRITITSIFVFVLFFMFQISYAAGTFESNKYRIFDKYVKGITAGTSITELKNNITGCTKIEVLDKDNNLITDEATLVGSKMKLAIDRKNVYEVVTGGDLNGDGKVTSTDILLLKKVIIGNQELDIQLGDIDCSSKITSTDLLLLKKVIVGNINASKIYETSGSNAEWEYTVNKITKQASIEKYIGIKTTINIPETIEGAEVKKIGESFAQNGETAKIVSIPKTVEEITPESFINCSNLSEINVAETNTKYSSINGIIFNKAKTEIVAYPQNKKDTQYVMPETITSIKSNCFYKTKKLEKLYIGNKVTNIEKDGIKEIKIGTVIVAENSKALEYVKANNLKYVVNSPTQINVTNVSNVSSINQGKIAFTAADKDGIVGWKITNSTTSPTTWNEVTQSANITKEQEINIEGMYYIHIKDKLGQVERQEVKVIKLIEIQSIKIISPANGEYKPGQVITIRAQYSGKVKGTAPNMKLIIGDTIGTGSMQAATLTGTRDYIDYKYTANDQQLGKVEINSYSGGNLTDTDGNKVIVKKLSNTGNSITMISNEPNKGGLVERTYNGKSCWVYIPDISLVKTYKNIPLIVYLHMYGESHESLIASPYSLMAFIKNKEVLPKAIVVAPYHPVDATGSIYGVIEEVKKEFDINLDKIALTGHSIGARNVWTMVRERPDQFSACAPVSFVGGGNAPLLLTGTDSPNCKVRFMYEESEDYYSKVVESYKNRVLNARGAIYGNAITIERFPDQTHVSVGVVYKTTNIVQWLVDQTRGKLQ